MARIAECRWLAVSGFGLLAVSAAYRVIERAATAGLDGGGVLGLGYGALIAAVLVAVTTAAIRRPASAREATSPLAYLATAGAVGALYFMSAPTRQATAGRVAAGELVAFVAAIWMLVSVLTLGRCFGLLPEARGLVTRGPYKLVRHPIYLGEIGAVAGLALASTSVRNGFVLCGFVAAQVIRMRLEEAALIREYPAYATYAAGRPRLVPWPFGVRRKIPQPGVAK